MSQHDLNIANQGFPAFRADLNDALLALGSTNSGATAPATTFANQLWYDTANNILKIRNEDNDAWISLLTLNQTADTVSEIATAIATLGAGSASNPSLTTAGDTNTGIFFPAADTIAFAEGGVEVMRIDSSGLVGIGTSSGAAGLTVYKYGSTWTGAGANTYSVPAGNIYMQMGGVGSQNNWFGFTGVYGTSTGSANILLQANINNTSQQAGNYIGSEATGSTSADLTFGRMIAGATVGGNASKSEAMRITSAGVLQVGANNGTGEVFAQNTVKVWGTINAGSSSFYTSFGTSSISKVSTGAFTVNFSRTFGNSRFGSGLSQYSAGYSFINNESTTSCRINTTNTSNSPVDADVQFLIAGGS